MPTEHDMYKHPPVALVTVEITFPGEMGGTMAPALQRAVGEVLGDDWFFEPLPTPRLSVNMFGAGPIEASSTGPTILRFADRDRGSAVAFTSASLSIETTRYGNWPQFRSMLVTAVTAAEKLLRPNGVIRVGLRYIDEIRVPGDEPHWDQWLSRSVLPPAFEAMNSSDWLAVNWTGAAQYGIGEGRYLLLRYGPQGGTPGFAVSPDGPLRRPGPRPEGPFFLLDFDASWQPVSVPKWDTAVLLQTCDELRHPVRALFDHLTTQRLIDEVFDHEEVTA